MLILKVRVKPHQERKVASILTNGQRNVQITGNQTALHGRTLQTRDRVRRIKAKPLTTPRDQPRASSPINDNYFVNSLQEGLLAGSKTLTQEKTINVVNCHVVTDVPFAPGHSQKRELSPGAADCQLKKYHKLKYIKAVSCVTQLSCVQPVKKRPKCCTKSACRGQTSELLESLAGFGGRSENSPNLERGLQPSLSDLAKSHKVSYSHKLLCQSPQEQLPARGITSAYRQKRSRAGPQSNISRICQPTIFSPQTQQQMETYTGPEQSESILQGGEIQDGDTGIPPYLSPTYSNTGENVPRPR